MYGLNLLVFDPKEGIITDVVGFRQPLTSEHDHIFKASVDHRTWVLPGEWPFPTAREQQSCTWQQAFAVHASMLKRRCQCYGLLSPAQGGELKVVCSC